MNARKVGAMRTVPFVDGKPMCPEGCGQPMEEVEPGVWRCSEWGPVLDAMNRLMVEALDRRIGETP